MTRINYSALIHHPYIPQMKAQPAVFVKQQLGASARVFGHFAWDSKPRIHSQEGVFFAIELIQTAVHFARQSLLEPNDVIDNGNLVEAIVDFLLTDEGLRVPAHLEQDGGKRSVLVFDDEPGKTITLFPVLHSSGQEPQEMFPTILIKDGIHDSRVVYETATHLRHVHLQRMDSFETFEQAKLTAQKFERYLQLRFLSEDLPHSDSPARQREIEDGFRALMNRTEDGILQRLFGDWKE